MFQLLVSLGILAADYAYHRWISPPPPPPPPNLTINIPTTADGTVIPIIYGRVRVDRPILVWTSPALAITTLVGGQPTPPYPTESSSLYVYAVDMAFVLGIGFGFDNHAVHGVWGAEVGDPPGFDYCQINRMWVGQAEAVVRHSTTLDGGGNEPGTHGGFLLANYLIETQGDIALQLTGFIELLTGNPATQDLFNAGGFPLTHLADRLYLFPTTPTPTWYRNMITVCLFGIKDSGPDAQTALMPTGTFQSAWLVGASGTIPSYAFEVSAYPGQSLTAPSLYLFQNPNALINGIDANPMDVLWDLLTGTHSKCRVPTSALNAASFQAAALTLFNEGNGFSRVWDTATTASDMIQEIDRQVDGRLFEDPDTGLIGYWLNRPDYDPTTLPNINPSNCIRIEGFTLGGQTDVPNVVQVTFRNRQTGYQQDMRIAAAQANSTNQGTYIAANVDMPGVCDPTNAQQIANRELTAQCRPLAKCSVYVSRDFLRTKIGDALSLTWPEVGISSMVMRVVNVDRGTLADGTIKLDLIQDYFYQWKRNPPVQLGGFGYHATESHT